MQVGTNDYAALSTNYQKPSILPIALPDYTDKEIYEGSGGNIVRGDDGKLHFTPQAETNYNNAKEDAAKEAQAKKEQEQAATRDFVTDYMGAKSKKTQAEIYLAVATDGKYDPDSGFSTGDLIKTLRDVQKQNNLVQAYAEYAQNQKEKPELY